MKTPISKKIFVILQGITLIISIFLAVQIVKADQVPTYNNPWGQQEQRQGSMVCQQSCNVMGENCETVCR